MLEADLEQISPHRVEHDTNYITVPGVTVGFSPGRFFRHNVYLLIAVGGEGGPGFFGTFLPGSALPLLV